MTNLIGGVMTPPYALVNNILLYLTNAIFVSVSELRYDISPTKR